MPPEATPAAPAQQQGINPRQVAENIAKGVQQKSSGSGAQTTAGQEAVRRDDKATADKAAAEKVANAAPPDPNAGKKKYVVEGKEIFLTPDQADAYVQKGIAFEPRISEIARMRQEMQQFEQALVNNPGQVFANIAKRSGKPIGAIVQNILTSTASDEVKVATGQWYWENVAKLEQMDPKDRQLLEQEQKIKMMEDTEKGKQERTIAMENINRVQGALAQVKSQVHETLKELGITNVDTPTAVRLTKEIADIMRVSYLSKEPCTAKQAADKLRARIIGYQGQFYDDLGAEQLVAQLGEKNVEKIRAHLLKVVKENQEGAQQKNDNPKPPPRRNERQTMNMDDFHDYLDNLKATSK